MSRTIWAYLLIYILVRKLRPGQRRLFFKVKKQTDYSSVIKFTQKKHGFDSSTPPVYVWFIRIAIYLHGLDLSNPPLSRR